MSNILFEIYHRMPYPMRVLAASLRGWYLRGWRYGAATEKHVQEALAREHWSDRQWQVWREERLALILHRAATRVPYYRTHWEHRRRNGDRAAWEYLENWPILEKETLRRQARQFVAEDCSPAAMFHEHTSGTTGTPLHLWWSRKTVQTWYALFEARCRLWHGVSRHDRWAILGGQMVTPAHRRRPPFWVWNAALRQLYLSSYHLSPENIPHYLEALRHYRVKYVLGYSSALHALAEEILRQEIVPLQMLVALTNAEPVYDYQRKAIARAFACPVRATYGMAELVAAAGECEQGRPHLWPEVGWIEIFQDQGTSECGDAGELICTTLLNADMPLIRYRVGDRGRLAGANEHCTCGRHLPLLATLEGRTDDILYTIDGRKIGRLDPVFKANLPIREAQIIQENRRCIRLRYTPAPECDPGVEDVLRRRLQERLGKVEIVFEQVERIPRTANGKFRAVISKISEAQGNSATRPSHTQ
jgi:phenylacetate-CoA ligase